jgi:hypothetical protein
LVLIGMSGTGWKLDDQQGVGNSTMTYGLVTRYTRSNVSSKISTMHP